jgi:hypothetical protein
VQLLLLEQPPQEALREQPMLEVILREELELWWAARL